MENKPINFKYYDPNHSLFKSGKSDRERYTVYFCSNYNNCDAYKRGKCIQLNGLWGSRCPYGSRNGKEGFTKSARNCGKLIREAKEQYGEVAYKLKELSFLCKVGDYIYLPLPHLKNYVNSIREDDFFVGEYLIKSEDFTNDFILELINYRPRALMGGVITSYQEKDVPTFVRQLKRYFPDKYKEVIEKRPDIIKYIENVDYVGKKAKVLTLLPSKVKHSSYNVYWDGKVLTGTTNAFGLFGDFNRDEIVTIVPNENTYVGILDNDSVTEDTEFKDE